MKTLKSRDTYFSEMYEGQEFEKHLNKSEIFDINGNLIEIKSFDAMGELVDREVRTYEGKNLIRREAHQLSVKQISVTEYNYNQDNLVIEEIEHFDGGAFFRHSYTYNESNQILEIRTSDESNQFLGREVFSYENSQHIIEKYDEQDICFEKKVTILDEQGRMIEKITTDYYADDEAKDEVTSIAVYQYEKNNLVLERVERFGVKVFEKTNEYDVSDNLVSSTVFNHEVDFEVKVAYKYNSRNMQIGEIEYHGSTPVFSQKTNYDANNNPIELIEEHLVVDGIVKTYKVEYINKYY